MVVIAHAGHWLVSALYALPVAALVVALLVDVLRQRRKQRRGDGAG